MSKRRNKKLTSRAQNAKQPAARAQTKSRANAAAPTTAKARRWVWPVVLVVLVAAALLVSQTLFGQDKSDPAGPWTLTILHTTDVEGYLDPCG